MKEFEAGQFVRLRADLKLHYIYSNHCCNGMPEESWRRNHAQYKEMGVICTGEIYDMRGRVVCLIGRQFESNIKGWSVITYTAKGIDAYLHGTMFNEAGEILHQETTIITI